jgi:excisionase family DNA binding protein
MAAELVLLAVGGEWLALTPEALAAARLAAREAGFGPTPGQSTASSAEEPLCDAAALARALGDVPVSWIEQAARDGRIPCTRLGRWVRFKRSAVEAALASPTRRKGAK